MLTEPSTWAGLLPAVWHLITLWSATTTATIAVAAFAGVTVVTTALQLRAQRDEVAAVREQIEIQREEVEASSDSPSAPFVFGRARTPSF